MIDDENIESKENQIEKCDENMRYIRGIFQYIKTKIKFGIIVVDSSNCYKPQNIKILEEIYKVINNVEYLKEISKDKIIGKPIYDYLFILNKIDTSYNKKKPLIIVEILLLIILNQIYLILNFVFLLPSVLYN